MAYTPTTLSQQTTLFTTIDGEQQSLTVNAGEVVYTERLETDTEVILNVRVTRDGFVWRRQQRRQKEQSKNLTVQTVSNPSVAAPVVAKPSVQTTAMSSTAQSAKTAVEILAMKQIGYVDDQENKVRRSARVVEMLTGEVYQLNYYIPSCLEIENPSKILRRHAFRLDGSNWVIPQRGLDHKDIKRLFAEWDKLNPVEEESTVEGFTRKRRMRYWVVAYTKEQLCKMKESAQDQLAEELQETHKSLIQRIESAAKDLQKAQEELGDTITFNERNKLDSQYNARIRSTINEAIERFEMCLKGAEIFDDTGSLDALFGAVREAIKVRALTANAMLASKGVKRVQIPTTITAPVNHSIGNGPQPR